MVQLLVRHAVHHRHEALEAFLGAVLRALITESIGVSKDRYNGQGVSVSKDTPGRGDGSVRVEGEVEGEVE